MRGFAIAGVIASICFVAGACSSSSSSEFSSDPQDAEIDQSTPCLCADPDATALACEIVADAQPGTAPSGVCDETNQTVCSYSAPGPCGEPSNTVTCQCNGTWSCFNPKAGEGACDAGPAPDVDASDASDDASDVDAF